MWWRDGFANLKHNSKMTLVVRSGVEVVRGGIKRKGWDREMEYTGERRDREREREKHNREKERNLYIIIIIIIIGKVERKSN